MFIAADTTATTVLVAQINKEDRVLELERQLAEQAKRIGRLEFMLLQTTMTAVTLNEPAPKATSSSAMPSAKNMVSTLAESKPRFVEGLTAGGDIRLRQEFNFSDTDAVDRSRNALRARLRATYSPIPGLTIGAQLSTGDPGDPNSTDVTLGNFVDDFNVSLDQVWLRYQMGGLTLHGGKFALIFQRTDMVWDGDFVPQGVGVTYTSKFIGGTSLEARAAYVIIEESLGGRGSAMLGGQLSASVPLAAAWRFGLSGGYYDYSLNSIATADAGDFRSNLLSSEAICLTFVLSMVSRPLPTQGSGTAGRSFCLANMCGTSALRYQQIAASTLNWPPGAPQGRVIGVFHMRIAKSASMQCSQLLAMTIWRFRPITSCTRWA